ncbi:MAG: hypothetical protein HRU34_08330 [Richelia sp.]|nr:hypothetical protein [Richelia sp.]
MDKRILDFGESCGAVSAVWSWGALRSQGSLGCNKWRCFPPYSLLDPD